MLKALIVASYEPSNCAPRAKVANAHGELPSNAKHDFHYAWKNA